MKTGQLPTHGRGLKDHEIARLASALRDELQPFLPRHGPLRSRIVAVLRNELDRMGLRIDARPGDLVLTMCRPTNDTPLTAEQRELAEQYLPLARKLSVPFKRAYPRIAEEFESAAAFALISAAQNFQPARHVNFAVFAREYIRGWLMRTRRDLRPRGFRGDPTGQISLVSGDALSWDQVESSSTIEDECERSSRLESLVESWLAKLPASQADSCRRVYFLGETMREAGLALKRTEESVFRSCKGGLRQLRRIAQADPAYADLGAS